MEGKLKVRAFILYLVAGIFLLIAMASLLIPEKMAEPLGYRLDNVNALNEFRAIYVGLWLAHTLIFVMAARNTQQAVLGDICGILLMGQVVGRVISLLVDGVPSADLFPVAIAEFVGAILIFVFRSDAKQRHPDVGKR